jgi:ATP-dependent Clp protease ATP-binding subunit ClpA
VGKTAIAEGLAYAIVHRTGSDGQPLPDFLVNKRILQLDVGASRRAPGPNGARPRARLGPG